MPITEHSGYQLLDDAGRPTFLSSFLAAHRAFRRDAGRFPVALRRVAGDPGRAPDIAALRRHWDGYEAALVYHHHMEDELLFPRLRRVEPSLGDVIDELVVQHHELDGTIGNLEELLGRLPAVEAVAPAALACERLAAALDLHLDLEEEHLVPAMRPGMLDPGAGDAVEPGEAEGEQGQLDDPQAFVVPWMADGLDDDIVTALLDAEPGSLRAAFPRWRADYTDRLRRWWW
jgi:iron-sulfur cluster repair protein YtfE (RIC family)